jgi:hypothetical protein
MPAASQSSAAVSLRASGLPLSANALFVRAARCPTNHRDPRVADTVP